jgi:hypothetical protein
MKIEAKTGVVGVTIHLSAEEAGLLLNCMDISLDFLHEDINEAAGQGITVDDYNKLCTLRDSIASISIEKK